MMAPCLFLSFSSDEISPEVNRLSYCLAELDASCTKDFVALKEKREGEYIDKRGLSFSSILSAIRVHEIVP